MSITTDPNHPDLGRTEDGSSNGQNKAYLVLSEEERAKGFVRPVRQSYIHVGRKPAHPLRELNEKEKEMFGDEYDFFEEYPEGCDERIKQPTARGRYWKQSELNGGCGTRTTMGLSLAETYAREPKFYGATFCCGCNTHLPVDEFVWDDGSVVGS